jgi:hypothetical protein
MSWPWMEFVREWKWGRGGHQNPFFALDLLVRLVFGQKEKKKAYTFSLMWVPSILMRFLDLWCLCVLPFFAMDLPIRLVSKANKQKEAYFFSLMWVPSIPMHFLDFHACNQSKDNVLVPSQHSSTAICSNRCIPCERFLLFPQIWSVPFLQYLSRKILKSIRCVLSELCFFLEVLVISVGTAR